MFSCSKLSSTYLPHYYLYNYSNDTLAIFFPSLPFFLYFENKMDIENTYKENCMVYYREVKTSRYVFCFIALLNFKQNISTILVFKKFFFSCFQMAAQGQAWQKDAADQNFDYMFKLLVIGNSSVGKTSFLFRYADDSFTSAFVSTVGIDFKVKTVFRQDKRVKLQIWVS